MHPMYEPHLGVCFPYSIARNLLCFRRKNPVFPKENGVEQGTAIPFGLSFSMRSRADNEGLRGSYPESTAHYFLGSLVPHLAFMSSKG